MSRSAFEGTIEGERSLMTQPHTTRYRIVGARANCDSGEEPSALLGQPYERAALVQPKPAAFDRELETCAVFRRRAAQFVQERPVDQFDIDAAVTGSMELAISISLRAAASGSAKGRGSTYFIGSEPHCYPRRPVTVEVGAAVF